MHASICLAYCVTVGDDTGRRIQGEGSGAHEVRRGKESSCTEWSSGVTVMVGGRQNSMRVQQKGHTCPLSWA